MKSPDKRSKKETVRIWTIRAVAILLCLLMVGSGVPMILDLLL